MYLAKLKYADGRFSLAKPLKLKHAKNYQEVFLAKKLDAFRLAGAAPAELSISPHEVLEARFRSRDLPHGSRDFLPFDLEMGGVARRHACPGSVDGEYSLFFTRVCTCVPQGVEGRISLHYLHGAYTFSPILPSPLPNDPYPIRPTIFIRRRPTKK